MNIALLQELVEERDNLEKQLSQMTGLLGQVEEKRLSAIKDMENMKVLIHVEACAQQCMLSSL